jgi:signal transduction histidine kinase
MKHPLEANLVAIFRLFVGLEMVALSLVPLFEYVLIGEFQFVHDPFFSLLYQSALLFVYLSIPLFQYRLQQMYLPLAIMAAVFIPSLINLNTVLESLSRGEAVDMLHVWALLPLLMIPLVPMAWQYTFRSVVTLFGGLAFLETVLVIFNAGGIRFEILDFIYATFIRMVSLLLVGFMISQLVRVQRQQRDQLRTANLRLTRQALVMEEMATVQERNRIARELHDTLAHTLSGLAVQLEAVKTLISPTEPNEVYLIVNEALSNTREGLNETRRVLKALRATPLVELGLAQALTQMAEDLGKQQNAVMEIYISNRLPLLSKPMEQTIYRIAQEALKNAVQHANARIIALDLDFQPPMLTLRIHDDGSGFDPARIDNSRRFGMEGMRERAELVGGALSIESSHNQGTTILFNVELSE